MFRTNQLAWKLRIDERVEVMEQTNFRHVSADDFNRGLPEFATIDVSFISLKKIFPTLKTVLAEGGEVVALIKPQFEAYKEDVGEKGIITDPAVHRYVLEKIIDFLYGQGFEVNEIIQSPIRGGKGNKEFLAHIRFTDKIKSIEADHLNRLISESLFTE
ncbi:MAG: hypothetical protein U5K84_05455 [Alkalibacterium sp.]|nr:hypothetical protein [Alkalibacterium sp.]